MIDITIGDDTPTNPPPSPDPSTCTMSSCFNLSRCFREFDGLPLNQLTIFVYPSPKQAVFSKEHKQLLDAVRTSRYAVADPVKACLLLPSVDLLYGQVDSFSQSIAALHNLPWWSGGENHLVFNFIPSPLLTSLNHSLLASAGHMTTSYRPTFDISIPEFNPFLATTPRASCEYPFLLTIFPVVSGTDQTRLTRLARSHRDQHYRGNSSILILKGSRSDSDEFDAHIWASEYHDGHFVVVSYASSLACSAFCLVEQWTLNQPRVLFDVLASGCIPVIADDVLILPFSEVLDWSTFSIRVNSNHLERIATLLTTLPEDRIMRYQKQVQFVHRRYFASVKNIVLTTLDILNDRLFSQYAKTYLQWNRPEYAEVQFFDSSPLFYPARSPVDVGFTALIHAHGNFAMLRKMLLQLHNVPRLWLILVVWTNAEQSPPHTSLWPLLDVKLSIIRENGTSRLFYPQSSINTEAVLYLDETTCLQTTEHISRAFSLWSQNPDRLVGLAPIHHHNLSNHSLPLVTFSGILFHKHYLHAYTELLSQPILDFVERSPGCEQLILNWLIVQMSDKSILVAEPDAQEKIPCLMDWSLHCERNLVAYNVDSLLLAGKPTRTVPWTVTGFP